MKRKDKFFVYIVKCADGTYYTGYTNNLENRIKLHNNGNGARYLKSRLPVRLVYAKEYRYYKNVLHAERNLKKSTRKEKERLIENYESDPHRFVTRRFDNSNPDTGAAMSRF